MGWALDNQRRATRAPDQSIPFKDPSARRVSANGLDWHEIVVTVYPDGTRWYRPAVTAQQIANLKVHVLARAYETL